MNYRIKDNYPLQRVNICFNSNIRSQEAATIAVTPKGVLLFGYQAIYYSITQ